MIPVEIAEPNLRRTTFEEQNNSKTEQAELDLIEEERELSKIKEEAMKLKTVQKYDKHIKLRNFEEGYPSLVGHSLLKKCYFATAHLRRHRMWLQMRRFYDRRPLGSRSGHAGDGTATASSAVTI
ncbi:Pol polyprotein [Canna indica]|uniref:Pol polyprotein n=1 Tax=Canna indica TaxID=4628 RepID=A0AAQ3K3J1_9LILI|nr:Pol polyprotein [Canna indica]